MTTLGFSVRDVMKKRLIHDMIRFVQPPGKWKIFVVDPITMKILNSSLKMYDVLEENVTLVEMLNKKRQPYPNLEAIYFLSPTPEAIAYFINDFSSSGGSPMYAASHLFFSSALPDALMKRITGSSAAKYIKNLKELFVDFLPLEQRVFTFDSKASFFKLYSPDSGGLIAQNQELDQLAKKLVSYFATLGDAPYIRYFQPPNQDNLRAGKFARMVGAELEALTKLDPGFPSQENLKGTLLIVDRAMDVTAPILHEFTYQAMVFDLLPLVDGNKYVYQEGNEGKKEAILDENDSLWIEFRHTHIADTIRVVMEQFNKFISENKAASAALGSGKQAEGGGASLKAIKETLAAMPQFQEMKQKYSIHINMAQECMTYFERRKLAATCAIEQDMATGETTDGGKPKNVVMDMVPLLDDTNVTPFDKVRLLMLYIIFKQGVEDDDRRKLLDHAGIPLDLSESITNLALLGVKLSKSGKEKRAKKPEDKKMVKKKDGTSAAFELSRYVPQLKWIVEDLVGGTLDLASFPYVGAAPGPEAAAPAKTGGTSLRSTKANWQKKPAGGGGGSVREAEKTSKTTVFVLGGMTYSEARCIYEVAQASGRDLLIGSSHFITPSKWIDDLKMFRHPQHFRSMEDAFGLGQGPTPSAASKKKKAQSAPTKSKDSSSAAASASDGGSSGKKKKFLGLF